MYELTDIEYELYRSNVLFRAACESAYINGFSKEQMLSYLCVHLLDEEKRRQDKEIERIITSGSNPSFITKRG
tara:strand:- start:10584 stop:10802 length:219 start_codon:yes stop_codon:yes gene_type:complete